MTQDRAAELAKKVQGHWYYDGSPLNADADRCLAEAIRDALTAAREEGYEQGLHAARQSVLSLTAAIADRARAVAIEECALKIEEWNGLTFAKLLASELRELTAEKEADT